MAAKTIQYEAMFLLGPGGATEPEAGQNLCRQIHAVRRNNCQ